MTEFDFVLLVQPRITLDLSQSGVEFEQFSSEFVGLDVPFGRVRNGKRRRRRHRRRLLFQQLESVKWKIRFAYICTRELGAKKGVERRKNIYPPLVGQFGDFLDCGSFFVRVIGGQLAAQLVQVVQMSSFIAV